MAQMTKPIAHTIAAALTSEKVFGENPQRKRYLVQNRGPGIIYVSVQSTNDISGILVANGATWIDEGAGPLSAVHCFEVWLTADTAATVCTLAEWT